MNKRAAEEFVLSIYWIIIVATIIVASIIAVYMNSSSPSDVREIDTRALAGKVYDCVSEKPGIFMSKSFDLEKTCNLYFGDEMNEYRINITLQKKECQENCVATSYLFNGLGDDPLCSASSNPLAKVPECFGRTDFLEYGNTEYNLIIKTVVYKIDKNV